MATTRRLVRAKLTSRSIIEPHSTLDDHAIADRETFLDDDLIALLETCLDRASFEGPWLGLDEDLICVILQYQRSCRDDWHGLLRREEGGIGKHAGLQPHVRIAKGNADLGAARVWIEDIADKEDLALEDLTRIGREGDLDRLPLC